MAFTHTSPVTSARQSAWRGVPSRQSAQPSQPGPAQPAPCRVQRSCRGPCPALPCPLFPSYRLRMETKASLKVRVKNIPKSKIRYFERNSSLSDSPKIRYFYRRISKPKVDGDCIGGLGMQLQSGAAVSCGQLQPAAALHAHCTLRARKGGT